MSGDECHVSFGGVSHSTFAVGSHAGACGAIAGGPVSQKGTD